MSDDNERPFYAPNGPPPQPKPGEPLFEVLLGHDRILCELRDHGGAYGIEAQFYRNEVFEIGRRFDRRMDPTRPPREMAIQWAEEWRKGLEATARAVTGRPKAVRSTRGQITAGPADEARAPAPPRRLTAARPRLQ